MKYLFILALLLVLSIENSFAQNASDSKNIDVTATIESAPGTCLLTTGDPLAFGVIQRPNTGTGSVAYSSTTDEGELTPTGVAEPGGTQSIGTMSVNPRNTNSVTVTVTFPSELTSGSDPAPPTIDFTDGNWASAEAARGGPWEERPGPSWTETLTSDDVTIHFQFGGTLSGISNTQAEGDYKAEIAVASSCPE